jgi:hypothetical protein
MGPLHNFFFSEFFNYEEKSLIIGLMRSIWSYSLVCHPLALSTPLLLLMHGRYVDWLNFILRTSPTMIHRIRIWFYRIINGLPNCTRNFFAAYHVVKS